VRFVPSRFLMPTATLIALTSFRSLDATSALASVAIRQIGLNGNAEEYTNQWRMLERYTELDPSDASAFCSGIPLSCDRFER
jgi:hypothetical protein